MKKLKNAILITLVLILFPIWLPLALLRLGWGMSEAFVEVINQWWART